MKSPSLPISARTHCAYAACAKELTLEQRTRHLKWCSTTCAQADAQQLVDRLKRTRDFRPLRERAEVEA